MVNAFDVKTEVNNALLVYSLSEFMSKSKCNLVLPISRMFNSEYNNIPKLVYVGERSNARVVMVNTEFSRVFFVDEDSSVDEQLTFNKEEYFIKHHIRISEEQHRKVSKLIGMYCNVPKMSNTFSSSCYKQYKVLELCVLKLFRLSSRNTRVCTVYNIGLQPESVTALDNTLHINDLVDDCIFTYCINISVERSTSDRMYSYIRIKYCGNINNVLQGLIMYMMDNCIDIEFSEDDKYTIENKILELEVE